MQIIFHRPQGDPIIDLERVKLAAKITGTDRDSEVEDALYSAIEYVQVNLNIPVEKQSVEMIFEDWTRGYVFLPFKPDSVDSVTVDGVETEFDVNYRKVTFDAVGTVIVTATGGFTSETLPMPIKQAILMLATDYLRNQQAQQEQELFTNQAVECLLAQYRMRAPL